ncbi:hypothetical protein ATR1_117d0001, partial [Acetobacter tropicalis]
DLLRTRGYGKPHQGMPDGSVLRQDLVPHHPGQPAPAVVL